jgi:PAS fold
MYTLEQLHVLADMPFLVFVKDEELKYVWGNKCFLELVGFGSLDELVGKSDHELIWSGYADTLNENDRLAMSGGKPVNLTESSDIPGKGKVGGRVCKFPTIVDGKRCLMGVALLMDE